MRIVYTQHGLDKFETLRRLGFEVNPSQVEDTISNPDAVFHQDKERLIAQRSISERHVLRVIYRIEEDAIVVITFYPGRKKRYENDL